MSEDYKNLTKKNKAIRSKTVNAGGGNISEETERFLFRALSTTFLLFKKMYHFYYRSRKLTENN